LFEIVLGDVLLGGALVVLGVGMVSALALAGCAAGLAAVSGLSIFTCGFAGAGAFAFAAGSAA